MNFQFSLQARRNRGGGGGVAPQIFAIFDILPIDNASEKKKSVVKTYKPFQSPRLLLATGHITLVYYM